MKAVVHECSNGDVPEVYLCKPEQVIAVLAQILVDSIPQMNQTDAESVVKALEDGSDESIDNAVDLYCDEYEAWIDVVDYEDVSAGTIIPSSKLAEVARQRLQDGE